MTILENKWWGMPCLTPSFVMVWPVMLDFTGFWRWGRRGYQAFLSLLKSAILAYVLDWWSLDGQGFWAETLIFQTCSYPEVCSVHERALNFRFGEILLVVWYGNIYNFKPPLNGQLRGRAAGHIVASFRIKERARSIVFIRGEPPTARVAFSWLE